MPEREIKKIEDIKVVEPPRHREEWYHLTLEKTFEKLGSAPRGLTQKQVAERAEKYGAHLGHPKGVSDTSIRAAIKAGINKIIHVKWNPG